MSMMPSEQHTEPTRYLAAACSFAVHRGLYHLAACISYIGMISEAMKEGSLWTNEPIEDFMVLSSCEGFVSVAQCFCWFLWDICRTPFVWGPWWVAICRRKSPPWWGKKRLRKWKLPKKHLVGRVILYLAHMIGCVFFWQRSSKPNRLF